MPDTTAVYLDYAATTPLSKEARAAWLNTADALAKTPGNPNSLHFGGRAARALLEDARERLADALGCERAEVIFTSGATESAALGVVGAARGRKDALESTHPVEGAFVLGSGVDHPAVSEQKVSLSHHGIDWKNLPVARDGVTSVSRAAVAETLVETNERLTLATLGLVCSETGVIQPVSELVGVVADLDEGALVHTDATQAVGNIPFSFANLGVDLMTIGGHKFGAPVGTGALIAKRGVTLVTDRPGGGQERKIRSGSQDVAGALSLSVAAEAAVAHMEERGRLHTQLREHLRGGLPATVAFTTAAPTVPSIVHMALPTAHPEVLLMEMDRAGICVSAGSACHAGVTRPSSVLLAMGASAQEALGVMRVSFGNETTVADIDRFLAALPHALERANQMDQYDALSNRQKGTLT